MLRGEILLVDLDPVRGSEANKRRLAILDSNDRPTSWPSESVAES